MGRITVITSGKGGVGKTTAVANLGVALSKLNQKVALVDMDMGLRNLDVILGLENRIVYDLVDVAEGICPLSRALIRDHRHPGLSLLPASRARGQDAVNVRQMRELTEQLARTHDHVLVDCPAGIEIGFHNALAGAHGAVIVTVPEVSAVMVLSVTISSVSSAKAGSARLTSIQAARSSRKMRLIKNLLFFYEYIRILSTMVDRKCRMLNCSIPFGNYLSIVCNAHSFILHFAFSINS